MPSNAAMDDRPISLRRRLLGAGATAALASTMLPLRASTAQPPATDAAARRLPLPPMTDGPFYPPRGWRAGWADQDADLTRVAATGGRVFEARGEHLGLALAVVDTAGRPIDRAVVEIWQCDALQAYRHPSVAVATGHWDEGFQGFGTVSTGADGRARLRTIRPVPYPGRTPHIHVKLRHPAFGERTSQLFVAGDPGNARDFLWRSLAPAERTALEMALQPAAAANADALRWTVRHALVVPA